MFNISTHNLPYLRNYEIALEQYNDTKPIRGYNDEYRPLKTDRSSMHEQTIRLVDDCCDERRKLGPSVACKLYRTDVIVYHPDGQIDINGRYVSQSTAAFIGAVSPFRARVTRSKIYIQVGDGWFNAREHVLHIKDNVVLNPHQEVREVLNAKRAAAVRKKLKPVVDYMTVRAKLEGTEDVAKTHWGSHSLLKTFLTEGVCEDHWHQFYDDYTPTSIINHAYREGECYDIVEVPLGTIPPRSR